MRLLNNVPKSSTRWCLHSAYLSEGSPFRDRAGYHGQSTRPPDCGNWYCFGLIVNIHAVQSDRLLPGSGRQ